MMELQAVPQPPGAPAPTIDSLLATDDFLASDLAPVDRGKDAWIFVASSFVLETFIWGFGFTFGVFQNFYTSSPSSPFLGASNAAISAIGTTTLAIQYIGGLLMIVLCKRYAPHVKVLLWCALAVLCGSLLLSSFASSVWQLIVLQGVLPGVAGGLLYAPAILWRRGLAGGLIFGGSGVGGAIFPPIVGYLLDNLGFRQTLRIWAGVMAVFAGGAVWVIKPRIPVSPVRRDARIAPMDWSYLREPIFVVVGITLLIQALAYFPVSLYMPMYCSSLGLPPLDGQLVLSTFNLFSVVGRIIFGYLCDRMPYARVMFLSAVGSAVAAYLLLGFAENLELVFTFVVVFGSLSGGFSSIEPPAASEVAGSNSPLAGFIIGSFGALKGVAAVVGPMVAGSLYDPLEAQFDVSSAYGSYGFRRVTLFVARMMVAAAAGSVMSALTSVKRKHQRHRMLQQQ